MQAVCDAVQLGAPPLRTHNALVFWAFAFGCTREGTAIFTKK